MCIGSAAHLVLERAGAGELPTEEARAGAWDSAIQAQADALQEKTTPPAWASRPSSWPYYELKRARTLRLASRLAALRGSGGPPPGGSPHASPAADFEVWREALNGRLKGRIDVVRRGPPKTIEDYKTGKVNDEDTGEIRQEYLVQMALYAVLEHAHDGIWPESAELIPLTGPPVELAIDPALATRHAEEAVAALDAYLAAAEAGELESLARPSAGNCRWCPFSVHCGPFWASCAEEWLSLGVTAMSGLIQQISPAGELRTLALDSCAGSIRGQVRIRGLEPVQLPPGLSPGDSIGVTNVRLAGSGSEIWATPATRVERAVAGVAA